MKVYAAYRGSYSDRRCVGIFSKEEDANIASVAFDMFGEPFGCNDVECWEIDDKVDVFRNINKYKMYDIFFNMNGEVLNTYSENIESYNINDHVHVCGDPLGNVRVNSILAKSSEHARKIAYDERAKYLAEKEGII